MKHFYYWTLFLWSCLGFAQNEPVDSVVEHELRYTQKIRPYLKVEYGLGALCNSISTSELLNFVSSDFLNKEDKEALLGSIKGPLRYGYSRKIGIGYQQPGYRILDIYKKGQGFSIANKYYNSANISHDLLELMFYGNKPYAGQTLELGPTRYETWYYTTLNYHFDVMLDSLKPIHLEVGLNVGHDYNFYEVKTGSLYTDPDGAFLDLDLDYRLRDRVLGAQAIAGLGVGIGAEADFRLSEKGSITLEARDVGFMVWTGGRALDADSTFRFKGVEFENIFDLNDSITQAAEDEYKGSFYYNDEGSYTRITPFKLRARYFHQSEPGRKFMGYSISGDYIYLAGYYPKLSLAAHFKTGYKQELTAAATTGGYNLASLDVAYKVTLFRYWKLNLAITNFSGLVVPVISGGAYAAIGLSWEP